MLLRQHRISPAPRRSGPNWRQFIRAHASAIIATDLFTIDTVLLQRLYVIVFIELGTRRLLFANCTANPDSAWITQQARNLVYEMQDLGVPGASPFTTGTPSSHAASTPYWSLQAWK